MNYRIGFVALVLSVFSIAPAPAAEDESGGVRAGGVDPNTTTINQVLPPGGPNTALRTCVLDSGYDGSEFLIDVPSIVCPWQSPAAQVTDISVLSDFDGLITLDITDHDVCNISALQSLPLLTNLNLSGNDRLAESSFNLGCASSNRLAPLASMSALLELYLDDMGLKSIPALNSSHPGAYNLVSLKDNELGTGNPSATCPVSNDPGLIPVYFMDVSNNAMTDISTLHLAPFYIGDLDASNNNFTNVEPGSCPDSLINVHGLDLSGNTFPDGNVGTAFDLSNVLIDGDISGTVDNGNTFRMQNTNAKALPRGMPNSCGYIDLSNNTAVTQLTPSGSITLPEVFVPFNLDLSGNTGLHCSALEELKAWYQAGGDNSQTIGVGCTRQNAVFTPPSSCDIDIIPEDFNVVRDTSSGIYYASWEATPQYWGDVRYEVRYREFGTSPYTTIIIDNDSETSRVITGIDPEKQYEFSISACNQNQMGGGAFGQREGCSPWSNSISPDEFLAPVTNISIVWINATNGDFMLEWDYADFYFDAQAPHRFEISNLEDNTLLDEVFVGGSSNQMPWDSDDIFNVDAFDSSIYQIKACSLTECGPVRSIAVIRPTTIDQDFPQPMITSATENNSNATITIDWMYSDPIGAVDYFKVTEFEGNNSAMSAEYYVDITQVDTVAEEGSLVLKRDGGTHTFAVEACHRDRDLQDSCSFPSVAAAATLDPSPLGFSSTINECFLENPTGSIRVKLGWEYNGATQPLYFKGVLDNCTNCPGAAGQQFIQTNNDSVFLVELDEGGEQLFEGLWDIYACDDDDYCELVADDLNAGDPLVPVSLPMCDTQQSPGTMGSNGGPGDLTPGIWWDEDYRGSGWYFYWANRLQNDETHPAYGNTYDLIAFWATYRLFDGYWQPVWVYSKLKYVADGEPEDGTYRGDLIYPKAGGIENHESIGFIEVELQPNDLLAPVEVRLQANKEGGLSTVGLSADDYFEIDLNNIVTDLLDQTEFDEVNRYDHLSGLWSPCTDGSCFAEDVLLLNFIQSAFDGNTLFFYDDDQEPIWANAINCVGTNPGVNCSPDDPGYDQYTFQAVNVIENGINPFQQTPLGYDPADNRLNHTSTVSRGFGTGDPEQSTGVLFPNISLHFPDNGRDATLIGQRNLNKRANLNDIRYFIDGSSTTSICELDGSSCTVTLTWYTDGPYPVLQPRYLRVDEGDTSLTNEDRPSYGETEPLNSALCGAVNDPPIGDVSDPVSPDPIYSVEQYECFIGLAGNYRFYLFNEFYDETGNPIMDPDDTDEQLREAVAVSNVLSITSPGASAAETQPTGTPATPPAAPISPVHGLQASDIDQSAQVGTTRGEFSVDASGAAVYNLPVYTVPGAGDVAPQVALSYSSQADGGVAGQGWSVSGLSMITRCGNNYEQDGQIRGVQLDSGDRFCLDGQRLVAVNGQYGADGAEYRTEIDIIARIHSYGGTTENGPQYFKVERKDGSVSYYGDWCEDTANAGICPGSNDSADSFIDIPNNANLAYAWTQDFMLDSAGNDMRYTWLTLPPQEEHIEILIQSIAYTGNVGESLVPYAQLNFEYTNLPTAEQKYSYIHGVRFDQTRFLSEIESLSGATVLRRYKLTYDSVDITPEDRYLVSVQECTQSSGNELCYSPMDFDWQFGESVIDVTEQDCNNNDNDPNCFNWDDTSTGGGANDFYITMLPIDFLGNGQQELLVLVDDDNTCAALEDPFTSTETYSVDILSYSPTVTNQHLLTYPDVAELPCHIYASGTDPVTIRPNRYGPQFFAGDFNADSFQDIIYLDDLTPNDSEIDILALPAMANASNSAVEFPATPVSLGVLSCIGINDFNLNQIETIRQSDINGDGLSDLVYSCGFGHSTYAIVHNANTAINGMPYSGTPILLFDNELGSPNTINIPFNQPAPPGEAVAVSVRFDKDAPLADFNGDGAVDLLVQAYAEYCEGTVEDCAGIPVCDPGVDCEPEGPEGPSDPVIHRYSVYYALFADGAGGFVNSAPMALYYEYCDSYFPDCTGISQNLPGPVRSNRFDDLVDINGDQLVDLVYRTGANDNHTWQVAINTGVRFDVSNTIDLAALEGCAYDDGDGLCEFSELTAGYVQYTDLDGNGYTDILFASDSDFSGAGNGDCGDEAYKGIGCIQWDILYNNAGQFSFASNVAVAGDMSDGYDSSIFADMNADGLPDHIYIDGALPVIPTNPRLQGVYVALARTRESLSSNSTLAKAANVITGIDVGIGGNVAITQIDYGLMTDLEVYTRGANASMMDFGEGSVVYDLIPAGYLVKQVNTSSPASVVFGTSIISSSSTQASVRYYYEGARIQAGGRGFLGFEFMHSFDMQNRILSTTQYRQDFPFNGNTMASANWYIPSGEDLPWDQANNPVIPCDDCLPPPPDCPFFDPNCNLPQAPAQNRSVNTEDYILLSSTITNWGSHTTFGAAVFTYAGEEFVRTRTPEVNGSTIVAEGPVTTAVVTSHDYGLDQYGNLQGSTVQTFDGDCAADCMSGWFSAVASSYTYTDDTTNWHLGRLATSSVTHMRSQAGVVPTTRTSEFDYDPATGILTDEWVQRGDPNLEVHTEYDLDGFGNRIQTTVNYREEGVSKQRTTRAVYTNGRFMDETYDANNILVAKVMSRDLYGNPIEVRDANGVVTVSEYDAMGREYFSRSNTGSFTVTTYHAGGASSLGACPANTLYHSYTRSAYNQGGFAGAVAPANVMCYDIILRETRTITEYFKPGQTLITDTLYDVVGRELAVSRPILNTEGAPSNSSLGDWSINYHDPLNRIWQVRNPDNSVRSTQYGMEVGGQWDGLIMVLTNELGQDRVQEDNALGERVRVTDDIGGVVEYHYDAVGNLTATDGSLPGSADETTMTYNVRGHKQTMFDPDKGFWQYRYNSLGELICQIDANGDGVKQAYDNFGRLINRTEYRDLDFPSCSGTATVTSTWTYDTETDPGQVNAENMPRGSYSQMVSTSITGAHIDDNGSDQVVDHSTAYSYDGFGRLIANITEIDGVLYYERTTYDEVSRIFQQFNAHRNSDSSLGQRYLYNNRGYQYAMTEAATTSITGEACDNTSVMYQCILELDRWGNTSMMMNGAGALELSIYNDETGRMDYQSTEIGGLLIHAAVYRFDVLGNLEARASVGQGRMELEELYEYDRLNRLTDEYRRYDGIADGVALDANFPFPANTDSGVIAVGEFRYDGQTSGDDPSLVAPGPGNLTYNSNAGELHYGGHIQCAGNAGPHAVCATSPVGSAVNSSTYTYDSNGNQLQGVDVNSGTRDLHYTVSNHPWKIQDGNGQTTTFSYDGDRNRYKRVDVGSRIEHTVGNAEVLQQNGLITYRYSMSGVIIRFEPTADPASQDIFSSPTTWTVVDHLGSMVLSYTRNATDDGWEYDHRHFEPFGTSQPLNTGGIGLAGFVKWTEQGFTGHETIESAGIIHMGGRIYDPNLGRFLQADPFVQDPDNSQSLNRYAYAFNNPLSYTDPSGYFNIGRFAYNTVGTVLTIAACSSGQIYLCVGATTLINTGTSLVAGESFGSALADGVIAGVQAVAFGQVGRFDNFGYEFLAHAAIGGTVAELQGGDFGSGAFSAGIAKLATPGLPDPTGFTERLINTAVLALLGGLVSEATGGKFANGATTAAIGYNFNQLGGENGSIDDGGRMTKAEAKAHAEALNSDFPGDGPYVVVENGDGLGGYNVMFRTPAALERGISTEYAESVYEASPPTQCKIFCGVAATTGAVLFGRNDGGSAEVDFQNSTSQLNNGVDETLDVLVDNKDPVVSKIAKNLQRETKPLKYILIGFAIKNNFQGCYDKCTSNFEDLVFGN